MILVLIEDIMAGLASGFLGAQLYKYKFQPKKIKEVTPQVDGPYTWSIYDTTRAGFRCPKCINVSKNLAQMPICSCDEYHLKHFHFRCGDCGDENIVRTADDR